MVLTGVSNTVVGGIVAGYVLVTMYLTGVSNLHGLKKTDIGL